MKRLIRLLFISGFFPVSVVSAQADNSPASTVKNLRAHCPPATAQADLDINNIRARILNAGVLHNTEMSSLFHAPKDAHQQVLGLQALWIAGIDAAGQLHCASPTYVGEDYWPGPINGSTGEPTYNDCLDYDKIYKIDRKTVRDFVLHHTESGYVIPQEILSWPGNLAPFHDANGDNVYDPLAGDYPGFQFDQTLQDCNNDLLGDQCLWWIFNDAGNLHSSSGGTPLGVEVRAMAFAYHTNDELNDVTFQRYQIINRSSETYSNTAIAYFSEAKTGMSTDDYLGCDVGRNLSYGYNADPVDDDGSFGRYSYFDMPPASGIDLLQGPLADDGDGIDNDRDGTIDETGERIAMSTMIHWYGTNFIDGNDAYNTYLYMHGKDMVGNPILYGGGGEDGTIPCKFFAPGDSDPTGWGTGGVPQPAWTELSAGNIPYDRHMLPSMADFTFSPGEVQTVVSANIWARDAEGGHLASVEKLKIVDDKIQQYFDNCFQNISCYMPEAVITHSSEGLHTNFFFPGEADKFEWTVRDFCSEAKYTSRNPVHTFCRPGTYEVCLTVTNDCGNSSTCLSVTVDHEAPGVRIRRIEGTGNGGNELMLTTQSMQEILDSPESRSLKPLYDYGKGPVEVQILDRTAVPNEIFTIQLDTIADSCHWKIYHAGSADTVWSTTSIEVGELQMIPQWGIAIRMKQVPESGANNHTRQGTNGFLSAEKIFSDNSKRWLTGVRDTDTATDDNWIWAGNYFSPSPYPISAADSYRNYDSILDGTWAPGFLCSYSGSFLGASHTAGVKPHTFTSGPASLSSVDLVFTSDKSRWSRCPVIELGENASLNEGGAPKYHMRRAASVDKEGNPETGSTGMGWFPGYAINVETGERLNVAFGEDSWMTSQNGRDMKWNPGTIKFDENGNTVFGGKHYVYVLGHLDDLHYSFDLLMGNNRKSVDRYDAGESMRLLLEAGSISNPTGFSSYSIRAYRDILWAGIPLLAPGQDLLSTDVHIRLRVSKPYDRFTFGDSTLNNAAPMYQFHGGDINDPDKTISLNDQSALAFPNPFSGLCTILYKNEKCEEHYLEIYDLQGKLLRKYAPTRKDQFVIVKEGLSAGVYIYTLRTAEKQVSSGRLVVQ